MASRTWLAVILGCAVWFAYIKWFAPIPPPAETVQTGKTGKIEAAPETKTKAVVTGAFFDGTITMDAKEAFSSERQVVSLSSVGGKIASVTLPEFRKTIKKDSDPIRTIEAVENNSAIGTYFSSPELKQLSNARYALRQEQEKWIYTASTGKVKIQKEYSKTTFPYVLDTVITIESMDPKVKDLGQLMIPLGGNGTQFEANDPTKYWELVWYQDEKVSRKNIDGISDSSEVLQGNTAWLAYGNRYFATALINHSEYNPDVVLTHEGDFKGGYLRYPIKIKEGARSATFKFQVYSGPKDYDELSQFPGLKNLIDYGIFSSVAAYLLKMLQFLYRYVHNYGVAIIILTVLVRLALYPLSLKSFRSMKAMQKLSPQIQALKEKHKDDMKKMNEEQMALFKAHNVNPMGGCLPMLVQLPVFIALYSVLQNSIELFHAPFFGWVHDLSTKDPFYVYPVLMGLSMLIQQKMTPSVGMDPVQQKMMYMMPVVFTFIMLNLPSGLTMYIFVSTLLGILQQAAMRDRTPTQVVAAAK